MLHYKIIYFLHIIVMSLFLFNEPFLAYILMGPGKTDFTVAKPGKPVCNSLYDNWNKNDL